MQKAYICLNFIYLFFLNLHIFLPVDIKWWYIKFNSFFPAEIWQLG